MPRAFARISSLALLSSAAFAQSAGPTPTFDIADVHVSPRTAWAKKSANNMQGGLLNAGRYELRRATMLDLIRTAYSVDADKVYGGPSWLDYDRFEVIAKAPPTTRPEALRLMLQSLLADRFKLVVKKDTKPVPAFVLSASKGQTKLKAAEGSSSVGCQQLAPTFGDVPTAHIQCRGVTMEAFASALRRLASGSFDNLPVVDSTGIEGVWDSNLSYPLRVMAANTGAVTQTDGLFESIDKELGLKLERGNVPQPVVAVESANETPTANPPGVAAALPPLPPLEFEVASIRPCDGQGPNMAPRFESGGRVTAHCQYLGLLLGQLWGLSPNEELIGAPKWLTGNSQPSFSIEAKAPAGSYVDAQGTPNRDALNAMMRALLVDRYQIKLHYEDRPMDALTLVAVKPKLTKADPANRTGCTRQNQQQQGRALPVRLVCQNMTMAQFAEQIQAYDIDIFYPVLDGTGIVGAWDFTLNYDAMAGFNVRFPPGGAAAGPNAEAADPSGAVSFVDSIEKQLGLKLEKHKRPVNVLVIDHIEEKPTDN
jgi:uncharacterized protein (TIGR03435 family)